MDIPRIPALDLSALSWWVGSDLIMQFTLLERIPLSVPFSGMIIGAPAWWIKTLACLQDESILHQLCRLGNPESFRSNIISGQWAQLTGTELGPEVRLCKCSYDKGEWKSNIEYADETIRTYAWKVMTVPQRRDKVNISIRTSNMKFIIYFIIHLIAFLVSASIFVWRWSIIRKNAGVGADIQAICAVILILTNTIGSIIAWYKWQKFAKWLDRNIQLPPNQEIPNQVGIWNGKTDESGTKLIMVLGTTDQQSLLLKESYKDKISTEFCVTGLIINAVFGLTFGIGGAMINEGSLGIIYVLHGILQGLVVVIAWRNLEGVLKNVDITKRARHS